MLFGFAAFIETGRVFPLAAGGAGVMLGLMYLGSPTWRLAVVIDDEFLEVRSTRRRRFRLSWTEIREVVASPRTKTCFVDGGRPSRSLLVPGPGASAGYDIENKAELYDLIVARVAEAAPDGEVRVREVELLEKAARRPPGHEREGSGRERLERDQAEVESGDDDGGESTTSGSES